jgi:hypothetical protein
MPPENRGDRGRDEAVRGGQQNAPVRVEQPTRPTEAPPPPNEGKSK